MTANCQYLIKYGRPGFVGRFAGELVLARGDRVVVKGPRGIEFGEVLVTPERTSTDEDGVVLRLATARDDQEAGRLDSLGSDLLAAASLATLPLAFVDVEVTLDGTAILHALAWESCEATPLLDDLAVRFGLAVRLLDIARVGSTKDPVGCGKPGCGAESGSCSTCGTGGGCSTGSCSRGSMKSAQELSAYFAELRHRMEVAGLVRTPLN